MKDDDLWRRIEAILATASQPLTKHEIAKRVRATPTQVNQRLYPRRNKWVQYCPSFAGKAPGWSLIKAEPRSLSDKAPGWAIIKAERRSLSDDRYAWQRDAISKWVEAGFVGIVQAVTGSGKTYVGIRIIKQLKAKRRDAQILIVVPTIVLMEQWRERLAACFPGRLIGMHGGASKDDFSKPGIVAVVAVAQGVWKKIPKLLAHASSGRFKSLLVADECHHYLNAPKFGRILDFPFSYRLGLSATVGYNPPPKRLGETVFDLDMKKAVVDYKLVPRFVMLNLGVEFTYHERAKYR